MNKIVKIIKGYAINISLIVVVILMLLSCFLIIHNRGIMSESLRKQELVEKAKLEFIFSHLDLVRHMDVTVRGFAVIREERYLYIKPEEIKKNMFIVFNRLNNILKIQGYNNIEGWRALHGYQDTIKVLAADHALMVNYLRKHQDEKFLKIFKQDKGNKLGIAMAKAEKHIILFEDHLKKQAEINYHNATNENLLVQLLMVLLGIPSIGIVFYRLNKEKKNRINLLKQFEETNRRFLFNPGTPVIITDSDKIIENSIYHLKKASFFINEITNGNSNVSWPGMDRSLLAINKKSLVGNLIRMRDQIKRVKKEAEIRNWNNQGLSGFSELIRNKQNNREELTNEIVMFLTKYLGSEYASLYVTKEYDNENGFQHRESLTSYTFQKSKTIVTKETKFAEGLLEEVFHRKKIIIIKDLSESEFQISPHIKSLNLNSMVIVPLVYNNNIEAILELAGLNTFKDHEIDFIIKAGEYAASALLNLKANEKIKVQNSILLTQNKEIEAQNEELTLQQEEIATQRDQLTEQNFQLSEAQLTIEQQNENIKLRNETLESEVSNRTHELVEYNKQLEQFAFISAHNLRAPVARILGLGDVLELPGIAPTEHKLYIQKLVQSTRELDEVIKDLSTILEIRKGYDIIFQETNFQSELNRVKNGLENEILKSQTTIIDDFSEINSFNTFIPYIHSILYNLITNAIKYRHPKRNSVIKINTSIENDFICLTISDNGLGIDLKLYEDKLFQLYKRFHFHVSGKGMGLFLVKSQVQALGGNVIVESRINEGATL